MNSVTFANGRMVSLQDLQKFRDGIDESLKNIIRDSVLYNIRNTGEAPSSGIVWGLELIISPKQIGGGEDYILVTPGVAYDNNGNRIEIPKSIELGGSIAQYDNDISASGESLNPTSGLIKYEICLTYEKRYKDDFDNEVDETSELATRTTDGWKLKAYIPSSSVDYPPVRGEVYIHLGYVLASNKEIVLDIADRLYVQNSATGTGIVTQNNPIGLSADDLGLGGNILEYADDFMDNWIFSVDGVSSDSLKTIIDTNVTLKVNALSSADIIYLNGMRITNFGASKLDFNPIIDKEALYYIYVAADSQTLIKSEVQVDGLLVAEVFFDKSTTTPTLKNLVDRRKFSPIGSDQIQLQSINSAHIEASAITIENMGDASIGSDQIIDLAITTTKLAFGSVTNEILDNTQGAEAIRTNVIMDNAITSEKIAPSAVTDVHINTETITGGEGGKVAYRTLTERNLDTESVDNRILAEEAVSTDKIVDKAATREKIADAAIDHTKIAEDAVRNAHLQEGSITADKLSQTDPLTGAGIKRSQQTHDTDRNTLAQTITAMQELTDTKASRKLNNLEETSINQGLVPAQNDTYDFGEAALRWKDGYFSGKLFVAGGLDPEYLDLKKLTKEEFMKIVEKDSKSDDFQGNLLWMSNKHGLCFYNHNESKNYKIHMTEVD